MISGLLVQELAGAPAEVWELLDTIPQKSSERVETSEESRHLRDAYLEAGILSPKWASDAHHIALATIACADLIVSWNFKHIVHVNKIKLFNAMNLLHGYPLIDIRSPFEIVP